MYFVKRNRRPQEIGKKLPAPLTKQLNILSSGSNFLQGHGNSLSLSYQILIKLNLFIVGILVRFTLRKFPHSPCHTFSLRDKFMLFDITCWRQDPYEQTISRKANSHWLHSMRFCSTAHMGVPAGSKRFCPIFQKQNNLRKWIFRICILFLEYQN